MYIKRKVVRCTGKSSSPEKSHTSPAKFHGKSFFISVRENWKTENLKSENSKVLVRRKGKFRRRAKVETCLNCTSTSDMPTQASKSTCPQECDSLNSQSLFFLVWVLLEKMMVGKVQTRSAEASTSEMSQRRWQVGEGRERVIFTRLPKEGKGRKAKAQNQKLKDDGAKYPLQCT